MRNRTNIINSETTDSNKLDKENSDTMSNANPFYKQSWFIPVLILIGIITVLQIGPLSNK